jgi:rhamnogalacturonyl hydrolase YesR
MKRVISGVWVLAVLVVTTVAKAEAPAKPAVDPVLAGWGAETLAKTDAGFWMPGPSLYALETANNGKPQRPGWVWDASIQLGALCSAARVSPEAYLPKVKAYATGLRTYRTTYHDLPGLDVNPAPKPPDRYYDDNAWISMSLLEAYQLTKDPQDLKLAREAYDFLMSGEDFKTLGGGIYWHEDQTKTKNACSSGPAMVASLAFYRLTGEQKYLETAKRLYEWTRKTLQDKDGLIFDSIATADGRIARAKLTYNAGTFIRAACGLYAATKDRAYLDEARRVAAAAEKRFVKESGIIEGWGKLAVKLLEGFIDLAEVEDDPARAAHWREVAGRAVSALHEKRSEEGWYALDWSKEPLTKGAVARLIDQSAAAQAYWYAAEHGIKAAKE